MTQSWTRWLPEEALEGPPLRDLLSGLARDWSGTWLARGRYAPVGGFVRKDRAAADDECAESRFLDHGIAIIAPEASRAALAGMMLDTSRAAGPLEGVELRIVSGLADRALDDLGRGLERTFGLSGGAWRKGEPAGAAFREVREAALTAGTGSPGIRLVIATDLLVQAVRAATAIRPAAVRVEPRTAGLAAEPVQVSALAGRSRMTMADLSGLSQGDIVVLDTPGSAPLTLAVNGVPTPARCSLEQAGDGLCFKILNAPDDEYKRA